MFSAFIFLSLILTFSVCAGLAVYLWPARRSPLHALVFLTQACYAIWALLVLTAWFVPEMSDKVILSQARQLFLPLLMPTWPLIGLGIFYRKAWGFLGKWRYLVYVFPVIVIGINICSMLGMPWAAAAAFYNFQLNAQTGLLDYQIGPVLQANFIYGNVCVLILHLLYLYVLFTRPYEQKKPVILMLAATVFHLTFEIIGRWFLKNPQMMQVSVAFVWPAAIALHYAVSRMQILDIGALAYEKVFTNLPNPVLIFDSNKMFWNGNRAALQIFDLKTLSSAKDFQNLKGDSELLNLQDRAYQVSQHNLKLSHLGDTASIYILNDVTEIQEHNETLRSLHEQLMQVMRFNNKVQTVLSHDLSGALAGQRLLLQKIKDQNIGGSSEADLQILISSHESATQLLKDVLAWSHEGDAVLHSSLHKCFYNVQEQLSSLIHTRQISLQLSLPSQEVYIPGSGKLLESVLRNLLSNAIKFGPSQGFVHVDVLSLPGQVQISFKDRGKGLSPQLIEKILIGKSSKEDSSEGFGMGLRFTLRFVEQLGGSMSITSKLGEGSQFTLILPVV